MTRSLVFLPAPTATPPLPPHSRIWIRTIAPLVSKSMLVSLNSSPVMEQRVAENEVEQIKLLSAVNDEQEGVIVELSKPMNSEVFALMLKASIAHWRKQGKRGIWIKVPIELVNLVEAAVKVLVVREKSGIFRETGIWKFPTGVVDEGEDVCEAAVREVKEETDWMPLEEYVAQQFVQNNELLKQIFGICLTKIDKKYSGFSAVPISSNSSDEINYLYFNIQHLENSKA